LALHARPEDAKKDWNTKVEYIKWGYSRVTATTGSEKRTINLDHIDNRDYGAMTFYVTVWYGSGMGDSSDFYAFVNSKTPSKRYNVAVVNAAHKVTQLNVLFKNGKPSLQMDKMLDMSLNPVVEKFLAARRGGDHITTNSIYAAAAAFYTNREDGSRPDLHDAAFTIENSSAGKAKVTVTYANLEYEVNILKKNNTFYFTRLYGDIMRDEAPLNVYHSQKNAYTSPVHGAK